MRKPFTFLFVAALLLVCTTCWSVDTPVVMGGKEIVAFFRPEALPFLYGALTLFAIAFVVAIHAAVRAWIHRGPAAETPAPPEQNAPATE
jgi:hypothetical protein